MAHDLHLLHNPPTFLCIKVVANGTTSKDSKCQPNLTHTWYSLMPCPSIDPKLFWTVQIVLVGSKLVWMCANCFGQVQIIFVSFKWYFSGLIFIVWSCPKLFGANNMLDPTKTIGTWPKLFGRCKIILDP